MPNGDDHIDIPLWEQVRNLQRDRQKNLDTIRKQGEHIKKLEGQISALKQTIELVKNG